MSNKARLQTNNTTISGNNTDLRSILDTVNALPDAESGGITPTGTLQIAENGTYDVTEYASAVVNVESSGGSDTSAEDALITRSATAYTNARVTSVGNCAFYSNTTITSVSFPNATTIGDEAFRSCTKLATLNFPTAKTIGQHAFRGNSTMTEAVFPAVTSLGGYAFRENKALAKVDFGQRPTIPTYTFYGCTALTTLILRGTSMASLSSTNAFTNSAIAAGTGHIYVPSALVDAYKAATNWSTLAGQIRAIEDYPDITGG